MLTALGEQTASLFAPALVRVMTGAWLVKKGKRSFPDLCLRTPEKQFAAVRVGLPALLSDFSRASDEEKCFHFSLRGQKGVMLETARACLRDQSPNVLAAAWHYFITWGSASDLPGVLPLINEPNHIVNRWAERFEKVYGDRPGNVIEPLPHVAEAGLRIEGEAARQGRELAKQMGLLGESRRHITCEAGERRFNTCQAAEDRFRQAVLSTAYRLVNGDFLLKLVPYGAPTALYLGAGREIEFGALCQCQPEKLRDIYFSKSARVELPGLKWSYLRMSGLQPSEYAALAMEARIFCP